jgi:hypothetical protein
MTKYTMHQLDRRFKMHRAGFNLMLVWSWPASSNELVVDHPWREYRHYHNIAEKRLGLAYYESINKSGNWKSERKYCNGRAGGRPIIEERIYIRSEKYLTLLQLAI